MILLQPVEGTILGEIYPPEEIFVVSAEFDDAALTVEVVCCVPSDSYYTMAPIEHETLTPEDQIRTITPIEHVTPEGYISCLSQAIYLLAHHLLCAALITAEIDPQEFLETAANHELYYHRIAQTFRERVEKDEEFRMRLTLEDVQQLQGLGDPLLFTFVNEKIAMIGDEMSFVYVPDQ